MRRYFTRPLAPLMVSLLEEREERTLRWCEVKFSAGPGVEGIATVVSPTSSTVERGVVLAHGGSDDGRRFFVAEAAALADQGAAVVLPVMRIRHDAGLDALAEDVKNAVLIERAALDVLVDSVGAPPGSLSFLGHSAGGDLGAILSAVEPRLSRIAIFGYGSGFMTRSVRAFEASRGRLFTAEMAAITDWFDAAHFVGVDRSGQLLVQHGLRDQTVRIEEGRALFDAASAPKLWAEYDWDHGLDANSHAKKDRASFVTSP